MRPRLLTLGSVLACAVAAALAGPTPCAAQSFADNFNRADSTDLGPDWQNVSGVATRVISNRAANIAGSGNNLSLLTPANFSATYTDTTVEADLFHDGSTTLGFVALAFGHNGLTGAGNGLYIKVQAQTGSQYSHVGFYTGVGNSSTAPWTDPPIFFTLNAPFSSAHMTVWASDATTINLGLDTDFNGTDDQVYTRHLNLANMTFGTRAGIGIFGPSATADNFLVTGGAAVPEPTTVALAGLAAGGLGLCVRHRRRRRRVVR
jgi:hypothetical protein